MATGKRFYWIKLKENFMTSDTVDFLMGQKDGSNYVVLYQMLCLKTINTNGRLERQIGEIIVPFDVGKIQRDCKWFSVDTIRQALTLFAQLGLVYADENGTLVLANYNNIVGSETDYAVQKRNQKLTKDNGVENSVDTGVENFHIDIRDKILDIDKDIYRDFEDKELNQTFLEYLNYRNCSSDIEKEKIKGKLIRMSNADTSMMIKILNQSMENGWTGLYELKEKKQESKADKPKNKFQDFDQRDIDWDEIEKKMMGV